MVESGFDDIEGEVGFINESDLSDAAVKEILKERAEFARVERFVNSWGGSPRRRSSTIFNQDRYTIPEGIFDQFRVAADAARYDDVVSNAVEVTEQLAFQKVSIECGDDDLDNISSQILDDLDIINRMREIWRELFIVSQCYVAVKWGRKSYRVKGIRESGRQNKKVYNLLVPTGLSLLDPLKVVPVGDFLFGDEKLVYIADSLEEAKSIENSLSGVNASDQNVTALFTQKYDPSSFELMEIQNLVGRSVNLENRLFVLNPDNVWRITMTRPSYQRFADVRLTSVFELLDLKHNLRESDRSDILGNLNCIVLVKKGDDKKPATEAELSGVAAKLNSNSRNSLMITDHRIEVEIITKKNDHTLRPERHNVFDSRITARLFQILALGNYSSGAALDDSSKLFKVIAAGMEARRDLIRCSIMDHIIDVIWDRNDALKGFPSLEFRPRRVALDFNPNYSQLIFDLYQTGSLSRQTMLDEVGIDQEIEAFRRSREDDLYGDVFTSRELLNSTIGRIAGGNSNGGGSNQEAFNASPSNEPKDSLKSDVKKSKNV